MLYRLAPIAILAVMLATSPLHAQDHPSTVPEEFQGMVGPWSLEQEDPAAPQCALNLTDTQVEGGWAVEVPTPCEAPFPAATSLAAWNIDPADGSVLLLDTTGAVTLRLLEDEDGLYDTDPDKPPRLYLVPPYDEDDTGGESDAD
jgi:hypothetical protein